MNNSQQFKKKNCLVDIYDVPVKAHPNIVNSSFRNGESLGEGDEHSIILYNYRATTARGNSVEFSRML